MHEVLQALRFHDVTARFLMAAGAAHLGKVLLDVEVGVEFSSLVHAARADTLSKGRGVQPADMPPSTGYCAPVMKAASSEARKSTSLAISSDSP